MAAGRRRGGRSRASLQRRSRSDNPTRGDHAQDRSRQSRSWLGLAGRPAAPAAGTAAAEPPGGRRGTGLPVPRYVSLKTDRVNLREGPSKDHRTAWVFQRAGLPVEIVAEYETWRRIRDSEGTEGWVLHSLLSGPAHRPRHALGQGRGGADRLLERPEDDAEIGRAPAAGGDRQRQGLHRHLVPGGDRPRRRPRRHRLHPPGQALGRLSEREGGVDGRELSLSLRSLLPILAIVLGIAAIVAPRFLNYIVGAFLILFGIFGLGLVR